MAARKTSKLSGTIIKRETQNKENNKIKPLCKFLRTLQVEHSGLPFTKTKQKNAVKGGSECQNYGSKTEQVNRIRKESGKKTSAGEISKSSSKSEVKRYCAWNDYGLATCVWIQTNKGFMCYVLCVISLLNTDSVALISTKTTSLVHKSPSNILLECNMELLLQICSGFILFSKFPLLYTGKHHITDRPLVCLSPAFTLSLCIATPVPYHFYYLSTGFVY